MVTNTTPAKRWGERGIETVIVAGYEVAILWSERDDSYVASVWAIPGCTARGKTRDEALREVGHAIDLHQTALRRLGG